MASTRAEQARRTRQTVLDTARRLFAERGYHGTSLQLIADEMGVRKANVYYYFRTKADLLSALLDERVTAVEELFDRAERVPDQAERRALIIDGFVEQVVIAHRTVAPVDFTDPAVRSESNVGPRIDALTERGLRLFHGAHPSVADEAAYLMTTNLRAVTRRFDDLPDDELRAVLRGVCERLIGSRTDEEERR